MTITKTCKLLGEVPEVGKKITVQVLEIYDSDYGYRELGDIHKSPVKTGKILKVYKNGNFDVKNWDTPVGPVDLNLTWEDVVYE